MKAVDTNVLLRFFVQDDNKEQAAIASSIMLAASPDDPVFVPQIVIVELVWVLRKRLKYPRHVVCALLRAALSSAGIVFEHGEELLRLLTQMPNCADEIADNLIAISAVKAGCDGVCTFDMRAARTVQGMELLT
ncbi:MAG: type II toxin-antitoxin system VapC family toxin [Nitratireductor sp.]